MTGHVPSYSRRFVAVIVGRTYGDITIEPDTYYRLIDGHIEVAE